MALQGVSESLGERKKHYRCYLKSLTSLLPPNPSPPNLLCAISRAIDPEKELVPSAEMFPATKAGTVEDPRL
jgi:hypothetical protein